jgi:hypothetical protein
MRPDVFRTLELSFNNLWAQVLQFIPEIVIALLVVIVGWIVGAVLQNVVVRIFTTLRLREALDAAGVDTLAARAGYPFKPGEFVGALVKWFVIIVFVVAALDILHLDQVTVFFRDVVLDYLPRVIVAVLILLGATVVANVASASIVAGARATGFRAAELLGTIARYAIILFAVLAALAQLEIAPDLVKILFMGIVFAASLAFGLSFGLGGRDAASRYIADMTGRRM